MVINNKGYTVGEVLAVMAVVGIIIFGAVATVGPAIDKVNTERGRGDAPTGKVDSQPRDVYQMPDRFGNIAMVCDRYGNAIYSNTRGSANAAIFAIKDGCQ